LLEDLTFETGKHYQDFYYGDENGIWYKSWERTKDDIVVSINRT